MDAITFNSEEDEESYWMEVHERMERMVDSLLSEDEGEENNVEKKQGMWVDVTEQSMGKQDMLEDDTVSFGDENQMGLSTQLDERGDEDDDSAWRRNEPGNKWYRLWSEVPKSIDEEGNNDFWKRVKEIKRLKNETVFFSDENQMGSSAQLDDRGDEDDLAWRRNEPGKKRYRLWSEVPKSIDEEENNDLCKRVEEIKRLEDDTVFCSDENQMNSSSHLDEREDDPGENWFRLMRGSIDEEENNVLEKTLEEINNELEIEEFWRKMGELLSRKDFKDDMEKYKRVQSLIFNI